MIKLGVLGSTRGTLMSSLIQAIRQQELNAKISIVISNKLDALILEKAKKHGLETMYMDSSNLAREMYDDKLSKLLIQHQVDLVVLIGYMRILSKKFVETWSKKIINVHPSLLPSFAGLMDKQVHQAVLDAGVKETGCTVHYVTEDVDAGPAVIQKMCHVLANDTVDQLKARVQVLEGIALVEAINKIMKDNNHE